MRFRLIALILPVLVASASNSLAVTGNIYWTGAIGASTWNDDEYDCTKNPLPTVTGTGYIPTGVYRVNISWQSGQAFYLRASGGSFVQWSWNANGTTNLSVPTYPLGAANVGADGSTGTYTASIEDANVGGGTVSGGGNKTFSITRASLANQTYNGTNATARLPYNATSFAFTVNSTCVNPNVQGTANFSGSMHVPAHSKAHTFVLKYNGSAVATESSATDSSVVQTRTISFSNSSAHTGDTFEWLVDGISNGVQTVTMVNIGSPESPIWSFTSTVDYTTAAGGLPTPTPAPTIPPSPSPGSTPYPTVSPVPAGSPPPVYSGGSGGQSGQGVVVLNPQDIYKPITDALTKNPPLTGQDIYDNTKNALNDAAAGSVSAAVDSSFNVGTNPTGVGDLTKLNSTVQQTNAATDGAAATRDSVKTQFGATHALKVPTSVASHSLVFPVTLPILGSSTVNLTPYETWITLLRDLCLFALYIGFWFLSATTIRSGIA